MKAPELAITLAPFAILANRHAMSPIYKMLEVSAKAIRGCAPWGILEIDIEIGIKETFWVEAIQFVGILKTMPPLDVVFTQTNTTLSWKCGAAEGKLALVSKLDIPTFEWPEQVGDENVLDDSLPSVLQFGSLSANHDNGLSSNGLSGVALTFLPSEEDPDSGFGTLYAASSDSGTISVCSTEIQSSSADWVNGIVINTEAVAMLIAILRKSCNSDGAWIDIKEQHIVAYSNNHKNRLMIRAAPAMRSDILAKSSEYTFTETIAKLPGEVVRRFAARAALLAEAKGHAYVEMQVASGGLQLSFDEGTVTSEEHYKIADLTMPGDFPAIRLDSGRLARALGGTDMIAFDAFDKGVITLFNKQTDDTTIQFTYLINSAAKRKEA